jgi:cobalt-zinc-cadmium efflux system membrane fusion protein
MEECMLHLHRRLSSLFGIVLLLAFACSQSPAEDTSAVKMIVKETRPPSNQVRLTQEEMAGVILTVAPVIRGEFRAFRDFQGIVEANEHAVANITTLVRGRVAVVYVDLGQEVTTGQVLAVLSSSDLGTAQSTYLKASAKLHVAQHAAARAKRLLAENGIGLGEDQRRQGEMIGLRAENREARDHLRLLGMNREDVDRLDHEQTLHSRVSIEAPFNSRVIARNLTPGEVVETTETLFVVADLSEVWVMADIPEKDIPFIYHGHDKPQFVEVRVLAYPDEVFPGSITYVGDVLDHVTRTMRLRIALPNSHRLLKPQMDAAVRVYSEPELNMLMIGERSVQRVRNRTFVFVQRQAGLFEARDVKLGDSNGRQIQALEGLQEGEQVVEEGAFVLKSELVEKHM